MERRFWIYASIATTLFVVMCVWAIINTQYIEIDYLFGKP